MRGLLIFQIILSLTFQVTLSQATKNNYSIGYRSVKHIDLSRSQNSINKELGREDSLFEHRTITTSMWYPTSQNGLTNKMYFGDFLSTIEMNDKNDYNDCDSIFTLADKFADYYGLDQKSLERIQKLTTNSYPNPDYINKKFPLVLYVPGLNGFSFENHLLCESIAAQGNIVISFNSKGSEGRWMGFGDIDFENLIRDIQFIIGESTRYPMVNTSRIVLIGHSIGGHANILTKIRDNRITGLVSLDGSIKHDLKRSNGFIYKDYSKINCPLLSISNQKFVAARHYLDSMYNANCFYIQTTGLKHKDYKSLPHILETERDSFRFSKYLVINKIVVAFIGMINGYDVNNYYEKQFHEIAKNQFIKFYYIESIPDIDDFKSILYSKGFANAKCTYANISSEYLHFRLPEQGLIDWANRLKYSGFINEAIEIYELIIDIYPQNQSVLRKLNRLAGN